MKKFCLKFLLFVVLCSPIRGTDKTVKPRREESTEPKVKTLLGEISGISEVFEYNNVKLDVFLGIPYVEPITKDQRYQLSKPIENLTSPGEIYHAKEFKPGCIQEYGVFHVYESSVFSEDCLYLNIWRRRGTTSSDKKAVIVIIHGGGFVGGDGHEYDFRGPQLAAIGDVIAVNFNYRLGIFGFLDMKSDEIQGNMGLLDQVNALKWVQKYISDFGGDPDRVTVFGMSAGSFSITTHLMSPLSKGLFRAAVMDAGVLTEADSYEVQVGRVQALVKEAGVKTSDNIDILNFLKEVDSMKLLELQQKNYTYYKIFVSPTFNTTFLKDNPSAVIKDMSAYYLNKVPLMIGTSKHDGSVGFEPSFETMAMNKVQDVVDFITDYFSEIASDPKKNINGPTLTEIYDLKEGQTVEYYRNVTLLIASDLSFTCPVMDFAEKYSRFAPTYHYFWSHTTQQTLHEDPKIWGATHGTPFTHMIGSQFIYYANNTIDPKDALFTYESVRMLTSFAKTLQAPEFMGVSWPPTSKESPAVFHFSNDEPRVESEHPRKTACGIINVR